MNSPYAQSLVRGLLAALVVGVGTMLGTAQTVSATCDDGLDPETGEKQTCDIWTPALLAGGVAATGILIARFGVEGSIDAHSLEQRATDRMRYGEAGAVETIVNREELTLLDRYRRGEITSTGQPPG